MAKMSYWQNRCVSSNAILAMSIAPVVPYVHNVAIIGKNDYFTRFRDNKGYKLTCDGHGDRPKQNYLFTVSMELYKNA